MPAVQINVRAPESAESPLSRLRRMEGNQSAVEIRYLRFKPHVDPASRSFDAVYRPRAGSNSGSRFSPDAMSTTDSDSAGTFR